MTDQQMATDQTSGSEASFEGRERWDLDSWPEMYDQLKDLQAIIFLAGAGLELNLMVFTVASLAAGCRHCQAHGSYGLDGLGVPVEKISALWTFEQSELFDERERAALRFAMAAGAVPNGVGPQHHRDLREHFSDEEVRALLGVVALSGFMNRFNDSLATVTDEASSTWAAANLGHVGWDIGKHTGALSERRAGPPGGAH